MNYMEKVNAIIDFYETIAQELNEWESQFIDDMQHKNLSDDQLSEKQKKMIDKIYTKG